jgi:hypothetical protein
MVTMIFMNRTIVGGILVLPLSFAMSHFLDRSAGHVITSITSTGESRECHVTNILCTRTYS